LTAQQQTQQQQQDELFNQSSQLSSQGAFRFGNQNAVGSSSQSNSVDEFPPLNRNINGDIGQDRGSTSLQHIGFGTQSNGFGSQPNRSNGLLSMVSANSRPGLNNGLSPSNQGRFSSQPHFSVTN